MARQIEFWRLVAGTGYPGELPKNRVWVSHAEAVSEAKALLMAIPDDALQVHGGVEAPNGSLVYSKAETNGYSLESRVRPGAERRLSINTGHVRMIVMMDARFWRWTEERSTHGDVTTIVRSKTPVTDWQSLMSTFASVWVCLERVNMEVVDE